MLYESTIKIASCYKVRWLIIGGAIIVVYGLANVVVIYPDDALCIVFLVESCLENKTGIDFAHVVWGGDIRA